MCVYIYIYIHIDWLSFEIYWLSHMCSGLRPLAWLDVSPGLSRQH